MEYVLRLWSFRIFKICPKDIPLIKRTTYGTNYILPDETLLVKEWDTVAMKCPIIRSVKQQEVSLGIS